MTVINLLFRVKISNQLHNPFSTYNPLSKKKTVYKEQMEHLIIISLNNWNATYLIV